MHKFTRVIFYAFWTISCLIRVSHKKAATTFIIWHTLFNPYDYTNWSCFHIVILTQLAYAIRDIFINSTRWSTRKLWNYRMSQTFVTNTAKFQNCSQLSTRFFYHSNHSNHYAEFRNGKKETDRVRLNCHIISAYFAAFTIGDKKIAKVAISTSS